MTYAKVNLSDALVEMAINGTPLNINHLLVNTITQAAGAKLGGNLPPAEAAVVETAFIAVQDEVEYGNIQAIQIAEQQA